MLGRKMIPKFLSARTRYACKAQYSGSRRIVKCQRLGSGIGQLKATAEDGLRGPAGCDKAGSTVSVRASRLAQLSELPSMRQQLPNFTCPLRRQAREHILQIGIHVMPIELGRLDQAHQRRRTLTTA